MNLALFLLRFALNLVPSCVCFVRYFSKRDTTNVCKLEVLGSHMVQHIRWDSFESEIAAPKLTHKVTLRSQIHEIVNFVRNSYEFHENLPQSPLFRFLTALKAFLYRLL